MNAAERRPSGLADLLERLLHGGKQRQSVQIPDLLEDHRLLVHPNLRHQPQFAEFAPHPPAILRAMLVRVFKFDLHAPFGGRRRLLDRQIRQVAGVERHVIHDGFAEGDLLAVLRLGAAKQERAEPK